MILYDIPGFETLEIEHVVFDYNGTLALDGELLPGVADALRSLAEHVQVHVLTADTFGVATSRLSDLPCRLSVLSSAGQDEAKATYIRALGAEKVVCIGNGRNDRLMLKEAKLGIAVLEGECLAAQALLAADIVAPGIRSALELLCHPLRMRATLRA